MEVTYTLTPEDMADYYREAVLAQRQGRSVQKTPLSRYITYYLTLASVPASCYVVIGLLTHDGGAALLTALLAAGIRGPLFDQMRTKRYIQSLTRHPGMVGAHVVRLDADGLFNRNSDMEWKLFWAGVRDIVALRHYIFFVADYNRATGVPRSAFTGADAADVFLSAAQTCWHNARLSWPPPPQVRTSQEAARWKSPTR